jgi:serine/threonine protein kinase/TolB-like protein
MQFAPGTKLCSYEVLEKLGAGAMGEVYRARDLKLGREVALKVVRRSERTTDAMLARFRREAQVLAALNHPNVAILYGMEEDQGHTFLVMELVEGETLAEHMRHGLLPPQVVVSVGIQICEGLASAHAKGIVHRDLKPSNIKLTPEGRVKILDFGLAKSLYGTPWGEETRADPGQHVTQEGVILGTPAYMSPEQAAGKNVDKRTDIWSFGVILFEMCAGFPPFTGETTLNTIAWVLERDPDWNRLPRAVPPRLRELIQRCLRKDPLKRLQDIGDARLELERVGEELAQPKPRAAEPAPGHMPVSARPAALDATEELLSSRPPASHSSTVALGPRPPAQDSSHETTELGAAATKSETPAPVPSAPDRTSWPVRAALYSILGILSLVLAYAVYDLVAPRERIAVLAVAIPRQADQNMERWARDFREELISRLQDSRELHKVRREITRAGKILGDQSPSALGRELSARYVVATDLSVQSDVLRWKISLLDTRLAQTLWTDTYTHPLPPGTPAEQEGWRKGTVQKCVQAIEAAVARSGSNRSR